MRKRKIFILFAAITAGSLLLNGCSLNLKDTQKEDTTLSAEMENLSDGTIQMHSTWYDAEGNALASAAVTFSEGRDDIFTGTTDENGNLELCSLPGNTTIKCTITDSTGETLVNADVIFKISSDYSAITIYPVRGADDSEHVVEVPDDRTELRAAIFVTEDNAMSFANISPYMESATSEDTSEKDADANDKGDADTKGDAAAEKADANDKGDAAAEDSDANTQ